MKIEVERIKLPEDKYKAHFRALFDTNDDGDVDSLPSVSLSRVKGKCIFRLDKMHEHDEHAPIFANSNDVDFYIQRVCDDIKASLSNNTETNIENYKAMPIAVPISMPGGSFNQDSEN